MAQDSKKPEPGIVGRNIKKRLDVLGYDDVARFSRKAGVKRTYVTDILEGRSQGPRSPNLRLVADALECTVDNLISPTYDGGSGSGGDPERSDAINPPRKLALHPSEHALIRLWRHLPVSAKDLALDYITELALAARSSRD